MTEQYKIRSDNIVKMRDSGARWLEIGTRFGLTRERCRQLYEREKGIAKRKLLTPREKLERRLIRAEKNVESLRKQLETL